jgi:hypothetical protein
MKVHVIMGNDYPSRVYLNLKAADKFVDLKAAESKEEAEKRGGQRVYWRRYTLDLLTDKS